MKRKRHTPEEIIRKLRTAEEAMASGRTVEEACRIIAVSMATYQRWKGQYSGVKKDALKRLRGRQVDRPFLSHVWRQLKLTPDDN